MQFYTQNNFLSAYLFYMYTIKLYTAVYAASLLHVQHTLYRNNLIHPVDWFPSRESNQFRSRTMQ